jgi:hypothetical protein
MHDIDQSKSTENSAPFAQAGDRKGALSKTTRRCALVVSASVILLASAIGAFALPVLMQRPVPKAQTITIEFHAFGKSYALVGAVADPHALERLGLNLEKTDER